MRRHTDAQLAEAIGGSRSWRGVLRALGLSATSSAACPDVDASRRAVYLGLA
jgi:hypothetical protein